MPLQPRIPKVKSPWVLGLPPYPGYRLLIRLINHLPEPLLFFLAQRVAGLRYLTDRARRAIVIRNLRIVLGPEAPGWLIRSMTRRVFFALVQNLVEFMGHRRFAERVLSPQHHRLIGLEHIRRHITQGRGVLLISAHIANWELGAALLAHAGFQIHAVALEHDDPRITGIYNTLRSDWGYHPIPISQSVRRTVEVLQQGAVAAYLGDRFFGGAGVVRVPFFGVTTRFPTTPARLALKTGAAFVPAVARRTGRARLSLEVFPELQPPHAGTEKQKAESMVRRCVLWLEDRVREDPTQWVSFTPIGQNGD